MTNFKLVTGCNWWVVQPCRTGALGWLLVLPEAGAYHREGFLSLEILSQRRAETLQPCLFVCPFDFSLPELNLGLVWPELGGSPQKAVLREFYWPSLDYACIPSDATRRGGSLRPKSPVWGLFQKYIAIVSGYAKDESQTMLYLCTQKMWPKC